MKFNSLITCSCILAISSNVLLAKTKEKVALDEVVIVGEKIEKNLQETVTSIQVFDEIDFLNNSKLSDMYNIFEQTSNINRSGKYAFNIRGINSTGIAGSYMGPRTVNVSIDGVSQNPYASKQGSISTWDMQQVEIMKGPQSTTQGRNSLAGAVVLKTKDPEFIQNGGLQLGYNDNNDYQISALQTGPITDNLAFRLSIDHKDSKGFVTNNMYRGDEFDKSDITNVRGKLLYNFDNGASALLTLSKLKYDDYGNNVVFPGRISAWNIDGYYNTDAVSHSLDINYPINNNWSIKSITSYTDETFDRLSDFDNLDGYAMAQMDRENDSKNQEFRFSYKGENQQSIIGLYHSQGKGTDNRLVNNLDGQANFGVPGLSLNYKQNLEEKYKNTAIFFNTDYYLNNQLTLILGARLDRDSRKNSNQIDATRTTDLGTMLNNIIDKQLTTLASGNIQAKKDTNNFLPKIGFNYKWNKNINTGFLYSKGYRPGGMSVNPISAKATDYDAEYTNNYELSFKSLWLNNRLKFNTNVFYTIWKDQQVSEQGISSSPFDINVINAGRSILKGIEIDTKYEMNEKIDFYGNIGLIQAEFDEYLDGTNNYHGNDLIKTPNLTANIGVNYRDQNYFIGSNISYTGSQYGDSANTRKIDSYTLVNLKLGYEKDNWALYLYANNLFDKEYKLNNYGSNRYEIGDGRVVGLNLKYYW